MVTERQKRMFESRRKDLDPRFEELREILLRIGGDEVILLPEQDLEKLIEEGRVFDGEVKRIESPSSRCHQNVADIYLSDGFEGDICTGWGLTHHDGLWRQHSWLLSSEKAIIETTVPRDEYYGVVLEGKDLVLFLYLNASSSKNLSGGE
ncbi:hypothetical protein AKJ41_00710 [candidate division MSBL1 archaeon SCGC-AAA259O05]|uniref:Uncharacterized protein n=1 Tax=candidate division MSBL1 archaeon SCGC-AAA259O05 TaxID=1698271 RepID=A0A133V5C7_9EURY|nr:hypothetical protein AKJ41_00710 [candidate division MSBL1 archaeon SCGC-AAA259O05]